MTATEIRPDIFWVGAVDWNNRDFHGYSIKKGTSYNAYLVRDEKTVLFDTVRQGFKSDLLHHLHQVTGPQKIDYIVVNHVELDHSGCLPELVELIKPEKIFCSPMGHKALLEHFHRPDWPYQVVKTGDEIKLGKRTVRFIETRMLHWPDSMFSYIPEEKLLISSDAFGQHWATSERFDDQVEESELLAHAAKYYANILLLYSPLVQKLLAEVAANGPAVEIIAPDHGLIWRRSPGAIIDAYGRWSRQESRRKAVIVYDTMWHSTEKMARAVESGLQQEGIEEIRLLHARKNHRSDIMTEVLDARALILGSATLNNNIMPAMADVLTYMKGLRPKEKVGAAFGSYGWSGEAVKHLQAFLDEMGIPAAGEGVRIKNVPGHDSLKACVELGRAVAKAM
ncbi:FprA family A-type flavoprotein [Desulfurivibrio sp. D14AmB]|uniref:FprA family A-type flavoprotein n=1 Tax=Desulfurivibrio sp. D14AmB TaxID=3374370 RepID=UPI00376ED544